MAGRGTGERPVDGVAAPLGDIVGRPPAGSWLVAGYFTPDYRPWAETLANSLKEQGAPFHLFASPKLGGGWEVNTRAKPTAILKAMDEYPDKVIVWLDADCTVHGDLSPLARLRADVAARAVARVKPRGVSYTARAGTMVFKPRPPARRFVAAWADYAAIARPCDHDQHALLMALAQVPDVTFETLPTMWAAQPDEDAAAAIILHGSASRQPSFIDAVLADPSLPSEQRRQWRRRQRGRGLRARIRELMGALG